MGALCTPPPCRYAGYSGELSPEDVRARLQGEEGPGRQTVLVDVREQEQREQDGIPQLKLGAR